MFETSVVLMRDAPRRKVGLFTASIAGHTIVVAAIAGISLTRIDFPARSPHQMVDFVFTPPIDIPPPLGVANLRPAAPRAAPTAPRPAGAVTAPQVVPPDVPVVPPSATTETAAATAGATSSGAGATGSKGTADGATGSPTGVAGGVGDAAQEGEPAAQIYRVGSGVSQPIVIHREQPVYPLALRAHMQGSVVVQCIVGRSGEIRDVQVVRSSFAAFEQSAVDAVRRWRFTPGMLSGKPVDTIFELTVNFATR